MPVDVKLTPTRLAQTRYDSENDVLEMRVFIPGNPRSRHYFRQGIGSVDFVYEGGIVLHEDGYDIISGLEIQKFKQNFLKQYPDAQVLLPKGKPKAASARLGNS